MSAERLTKRYSRAFKHNIVSQIESGNLTIAQAKRLYDINGNGTVERWLRQLGKNHLIAKQVRIQTPDEVSRLKEIETEKQQLESALAKAHIKILSLETLLEQYQQENGHLDKKHAVIKP